MITKEELALDFIKTSMASAEGLGQLDEETLKSLMRQVVQISLALAEVTIEELYGDSND